MRGCRTAPRIDVLQPLMPQQGPHCSRMPRLTGRTAVREKMRKPQAVDYLYSYSQSLTLKLSVTPSASPPLPATLKLLPSLSEFAFQHTHTRSWEPPQVPFLHNPFSPLPVAGRGSPETAATLAVPAAHTGLCRCTSPADVLAAQPH